MYNQPSDIPNFRPIPPSPSPAPSSSSSSSSSSASSSSSSSSSCVSSSSLSLSSTPAPLISQIQPPHYAMLRPQQYRFGHPRVQNQPHLGFRPAPQLGFRPETLNLPPHPQIQETIGLKETPNISTHYHHPHREASETITVLPVPPVPRPMSSSFQQSPVSSQWAAQPHFQTFPHSPGRPFSPPNIRTNVPPHGHLFMPHQPGPFQSSVFHPAPPIPINNHQLPHLPPPPPPPSSPPPPPPPPSNNEEFPSVSINSDPYPDAPSQSSETLKGSHGMEASSIPDNSNLCPPEPPRPTDLEMLKNIEVLAAFVAKNGPRFESMARARQAGDPKFAFLFESESTPEASIGHQYYKWKKQVLSMEVRKGSIRDGCLEMYGSVSDPKAVIGQCDEGLDSPVVSDMDMEDDFVPTLSVGNEQLKSGILEAGDSKGEARDSKGEANNSKGELKDFKGEETLDSKAIFTASRDLQLNAGPSAVESFRGVSHYEHLRDSNVKRYNIVHDDDEKRKNLVSNPSFESRTEIVVLNAVNRKDERPNVSDNGAKLDVGDQDKLHSNWKQADGIINKTIKHPNIVKGSQEKDASSVLLLDRTSECLIGITDQSGFLSRDRTQQDCQRDSKPQCDREWRPAKSPSNLVKHRFPVKISHSPEHIKSSHYSEYDTGQASRIAEMEIQNRFVADAEERHETKDLVVDKFGRVVRKGAKESDSDEEQRKKRRRSYSRSRSGTRSSSRSRSPSESRRNISHSTSSERWNRRRSFSRSPVRRGRSRSWSHSPPRRRRDYSRSPVREGKWGVERDKRVEHDSYGSGRRGGRQSGPNCCFNYARGRCFRGNACKFFHQDRETVEERGTSSVTDDDERSHRYDDAGQEPQTLNKQRSPHINADDHVHTIHWSKGDRDSGLHNRGEALHLRIQENDIRIRAEEKASNILKNSNVIQIVSEHKVIEGMGAKAVGIQDETGTKIMDVESRDLGLESKYSEKHDQDDQFKVSEVIRPPIVGAHESSSGHQHILSEQMHKITLPYHTPFSQVSPLGPPTANAFTKSGIISSGMLNPPQILASHELGFMDVNAMPRQSLPGDHDTHFLRAPMHRLAYPSQPPSHENSSYLSSISQPSFTQGIHQQSASPNTDFQNFSLQCTMAYHAKDLESGKHGFAGDISLSRDDSTHSPYTQNHYIIPSSAKSSQHTFPKSSITPPSSDSYRSVPAEQPSSYSYSLTTIPPLNLPGGLDISRLREHDSSFDALDLGTSRSIKENSSKNPTVVVGTLESANPARDSEKSMQYINRSGAEKGVPQVGIVENVSPPAGDWSPGGGPVAGNDETKPHSKKSIRGLKLLRSAVAEQVKLLLKPTWREGQLSKDAYKTIVKKAVEKVTGNMPSHHIPKSQEKIDQFMSVSSLKISKLVKGYIDKYLKL